MDMCSRVTANHTIKNATIIISAVFLLYVTINNAFSHEDKATVVRIAQTLLSKKLPYHIKVDGICKSQTRTAIIDYLTPLGKTPQGDLCKIDVIKNVNDLILSATPATTQADDKVLALSSRIDSIKSEEDKLKSEVDRLQPRSEEIINNLAKTEGKVDHFESAAKLEQEILKGYISEEKAKIGSSELTLGGSLLGIFTTLIGMLIGIGYVIKLFVTKDVIDEAKGEINNEINKLKEIIDKEKIELKNEVTKAMKNESIIILGETYLQLAYTWWEHYSYFYQEFLRGEITETEKFARDMKLTIGLTEEGLGLLNREVIEKNKITDARALIIYAKLRNQAVYHVTAELRCNKRTTESADSRVKTLISQAEECLRLSKNEEIKRWWYNFQETAAVALIAFGDGGDKINGRRIICDILEKKTPGPHFEEPPDKWLIKIWNQHFPEDHNGTRQDLLGFGKILPRPEQTRPT